MTPTDLDQHTKTLDKAHVFHSWSAQAALDPLVVAGGLGSPGVGPRRAHATSTSPASWSTSTSATSTRRSSRRSRSRRRRWRPSRRRRPTWPAARRRGGSPTGRRRGAEQGVLHQRRRRRDRERHPDGAAAHRARQGRLDLPQLPRQHRRRRRRDRRLAAGAQRVRPRPTCTSSGRSSTAASSGRPRPRRSRERALQHLRRVIECEGPASVAAVLLETIPGTAGRPGAAAGLPGRRARAVRRARHRADPRRGDGRVRAGGGVVRPRRLRRRVAAPT